MGRADGTAQLSGGIANQEPRGGFEKSSSAEVQGKRAAKSRRKTNLGTLLLCLFQQCKLGRGVLKEVLKETQGKEKGIGREAEGHVVVCLGSSESHAPTCQPSDRGCDSVFLCWGGGAGSYVHKPPGNFGIKCHSQECSNFTSFKYIFSPLLIIKVQGRDASFLVDICFDS